MWTPSLKGNGCWFWLPYLIIATSSSLVRCMLCIYIFNIFLHQGEFREPISCCYDNWGRLLVSDHCNYRVQLFDTHYQYITDFGKYGKSSGEFWGVNGICSHRNGDILVVDSDNNCLSVHSSDGRFISVFGRYVIWIIIHLVSCKEY